MQDVGIKETNLSFTSLTQRKQTDQIVIHHLGIVDSNGVPYNRDMNAEEIHQEHLNQGWSGIGYHYVIRQDGTIERGRPKDMVGAHAEGENYHTIGIVVTGTFMNNFYPTDAQIISLSKLCAVLCSIYDLDIQHVVDGKFIVGHRDVNSTICPGDNLYNQLPTIIGKAIWFQQN